METDEMSFMQQKYNEMKRNIPKTSVIVYDYSKDIKEKYHIGSVIEGTCRSLLAQFRYCIHRELDLKRVVKSYYIADAQLTTTGLYFPSHPIQDFDLILNEIKALCELSHPNILRLYDVFFDGKFIHLVVEYCKGGELFDLLAMERLSLSDAMGIFIQLTEAITHIHSRGYAHRGLCIENVMFVNSDKKRVKLIGFNGCSKYLGGFKFRYGSPMYMAPEVFNENYTEACDVWSCGVIFFTMVVGHQPFQSSNFNDLRKKVVNNEMIKSNGWKSLDKEVKKFIRTLISVKKRPTADGILKLPLVKKYLSQNSKAVIKRLMKSVKSIRTDMNFTQKIHLGNKLKIAMYKILAPLNVLHDLYILESLWNELDVNGQDVILESDLVQNIETLLSKSELSEKAYNMLKKFDLDCKGRISKDEFIGLLIEISDKYIIRQSFNTLDTDSDGFVSPSDYDSYFKCHDYEKLKTSLTECFDRDKLDFETYNLLVTRFVVSFS